MVFIVTCSVAEIKAAFASAYRTGSIRRFHFKGYSLRDRLRQLQITGTDHELLRSSGTQLFEIIQRRSQ